jgi:hypothetical protein
MGGSLLLPGIVSELLADGATPSRDADPLAPRAPHFPGKAKRVIFLFMTGGVSHLETFDPKPRLAADAGKPHKGRTLLGPQFPFAPGRPVRDAGQRAVPARRLLRRRPVRHPLADRRPFRALPGDAARAHRVVERQEAEPGVVGQLRPGHRESQPAVVRVLAPHLPYAGTQAWSSDFLPVCHQGTRIQPGAEPIRDLRRRAPSEAVQEGELDLLARFNRRHQASRPADPLLAGRIKSFETAFGMQREMPEVLDLSGETDATLDLYGLERGRPEGFAWQCLVARRMAERGVRFVELIDSGSSNNWDSHGAMKDHVPKARAVDRAIAGLLKDLKGRGMLDDTLVVWTTEFGRTPHTDGPTGRGHHPFVFSSWMAGAGSKAGRCTGPATTTATSRPRTRSTSTTSTPRSSTSSASTTSASRTVTAGATSA